MKELQIQEFIRSQVNIYLLSSGIHTLSIHGHFLRVKEAKGKSVSAPMEGGTLKQANGTSAVLG